MPAKRRTQKTGLPPGTPVYIGKERTKKVKITVMNYDEKNFLEKELNKVEECLPFKNKSGVTWINIDGIHNVGIVEKIGKFFDLHPLTVEDIVNTNQRPKIEDFNDYDFIVLKMLYMNSKKNLVDEQVSLILGKNFVISFQEKEGDVFDYVRERIRSSKGKIKSLGADYLAYALMDAIVDNYFAILERFEDSIEGLQERLVKTPTRNTLQVIHHLKREVGFLKKAVWPLREVIASLEKQETPLITKPTLFYLRDVYDHTIQVIDTTEAFKDSISGMLDIYLSSVSNKTNQIMKVLTIIATIFIPLTFITGIYGMNFKYMPELTWRYGYPIVLIIMAIVVILMIVYFKKKKWF